MPEEAEATKYKVNIHLRSGQTIFAIVTSWETTWRSGEIVGFTFAGLSSHSNLHLDAGQISAVEIKEASRRS